MFVLNGLLAKLILQSSLKNTIVYTKSKCKNTMAIVLHKIPSIPSLQALCYTKLFWFGVTPALLKQEIIIQEITNEAYSGILLRYTSFLYHGYIFLNLWHDFFLPFFQTMNIPISNMLLMSGSCTIFTWRTFKNLLKVNTSHSDNPPCQHINEPVLTTLNNIGYYDSDFRYKTTKVVAVCKVLVGYISVNANYKSVFVIMVDKKENVPSDNAETILLQRFVSLLRRTHKRLIQHKHSQPLSLSTFYYIIFNS